MKCRVSTLTQWPTHSGQSTPTLYKNFKMKVDMMHLNIQEQILSSYSTRRAIRNLLKGNWRKLQSNLSREWIQFKPIKLKALETIVIVWLTKAELRPILWEPLMTGWVSSHRTIVRSNLNRVQEIRTNMSHHLYPQIWVLFYLKVDSPCYFQTTNLIIDSKVSTSKRWSPCKSMSLNAL